MCLWLFILYWLIHSFISSNLANWIFQSRFLLTSHIHRSSISPSHSFTHRHQFSCFLQPTQQVRLTRTCKTWILQQPPCASLCVIGYMCVCESVRTSFILSFHLSWCEPWRLCITVYSVLEGTVIDGFIIKTQWIISRLDAGRRWLQRVRKCNAKIPRSPFGPGWTCDNVSAKPRQKRSKSGLI